MRLEMDTHMRLHHLGTCEWIYQNSTFKAWDNATTSAATWYHAGPGAGKTILASSLTRHLQDRGSKVIYFFYSFNDPTRSQSLHAIRCLTLQLLDQCDVIPEKICRLYESNRMFGLRSLETIVAVFQALLDCSSRTHVVLDGLDECSDRPVMTNLFTKLISLNTCGLVKWFFTSRHERDIRLLAQETGASDIVPSITTINGDIKKYLEHSMTKNGHADSCANIWAKASEGNFLWITLMHATLTGGSTCEEDLEAELRKFPKGLTGCYLRGLQQLSLRLDTHQELAR